MNKRTLACAALSALVASGLVGLAGCGQSSDKPTANVMEIPPKATGPKEPIGKLVNGIRLVYPHDKDQISAPSTFLIGAVAPGTALTVNGQPVKINAQGYFAHVVPLVVGNNTFTLQRAGAGDPGFALSLKRPGPTAVLPATPAQLVPASLQPRQEIGAQPGDIVQFAARGTPGADVVVKLGARTIKLQPASASKIKSGLDTSFGVQYQSGPKAPADLYTGFYRVTASDNWQRQHPEFILTKNGISVKASAPGTVSVLSQPLIATTLQDDTIVRVGPGAGRTTPWAAGVQMLVDGYFGDSYRVEVAPGKHLWVEKSALQLQPQGGTPPTANVRTINIESDRNDGARIVIPLSQRLPYEIKQEVSPENKLVLRIYGATADTDWITEPATSSRAVEQAAGRTVSAGQQNGERNPVKQVNWQQDGDRVYKVNVSLNTKQQWGYWLEYEDTNLVLHVKNAPKIAVGENSLRGLRICLDPGHGGRETGAIGCSGIKEATVNLAIAKRAERMLREQGAEVIMTRTDDYDVSLADRVAIANDTNVDLLVSVHNNSLPDGRNPWTEHGTSTYYYHPQSMAPANAARKSMVANTGLRDFNTRWQNLALCRPSKMPATLVEVAFMINPDEYAFLLSEAGQERAATGIVDGVRNFFQEALGGTAPPAQ